MEKPYIISVASQKGGVGKTTVAVNIATSLQYAGYKVLLVDGDTTNPSVSFHFGMEKANIGYKQLIKDNTKLRDVISVHGPSGVHVICGTLNSKPFVVSPTRMHKMINELRHSEYDYVIFDTQPGYYIKGIMKYIDETILITTPDMPSCASIVRAAGMLDEEHAKHSLIVNRVKNKRYELHTKEIGEMYEGRLIGTLPEDEIVPMSIEAHIPAILIDKKNSFSRSINDVSRYYASGNNEYNSKESYAAKGGASGVFFGFLRRLFKL